MHLNHQNLQVMSLQLGSPLSCVLLLLVGVALTSSKAAITPSRYDTAFLNRSSFPAGFIFGTASASYQYEGAAREDGRGPSIWDTYTQKYPEKITDGSNGDVANDEYHRYKEDVGIMKNMGLDAYRFSISWSRLLPNGKLSGGINKEGIKYYNNLINELLRHGVKPFVTLFHFDLPQALEDEYGGFLSPKIVFMEPLTSGDYPHSMRSLVGSRLPKFTKEQSKLLKGSFDFLGLNYYTAYYASYAPSNNSVNASYLTDARSNQSPEKNGVPIGPKAASDWLYVYPRGIQDLLLYTKEKYHDPLIYITENGVDEFNDPKLSLVEALNDTQRVYYYYHHIYYLHRAIKDGVNVKGYFAWSLLDNFEWSSGYTVRFGINYVDYNNNRKRYPKLSAHWFKSFLKKY
ncbi:hypothetical protein DVH24_035179 [Malus domestica]|uniref:Beta-glucosidase n=1 Tax=Malus domestica TaxID=3750 RepID=A0A498J6N8_MALDO|nr:hypothetical protein DVH24_035179 [Malus domestica]